MDLPNLLKLNSNKDTPNSRYVVVQIDLESVRTAVWEVLGNTPTVVQLGSIELVDTTKPKLLLEAIDTSLSQALTGIDPEPNEMVLSLPDSWLIKNDIAADKKQLLKYISQELELKPIGFVITIEAIANYLETKKGQPPNVILLGLSNEDVSVSVLQNGKILSTHVVGRSDDVGSDVEEGIARAGDIKTLPPHIVLFGTTLDLEQLQQELIEYDWQSRLPFLHIPKIDQLQPDEVMDSIILTGGNEVIKTTHPELSEADFKADSQTALVEESSQEELPDKAEDFGFKVTHPESFQENSDENENISEEDPLTNLDEVESNVTPIEDLPILPQEEDEDWEGDETLDVPTNKGLLSLLPFGKKKAGTDIPKKVNTGKLVVIFSIVLLGLVGLAGVVGVAYWYIPTSQITLYLEPRVITRDISFRIDGAVTSLDSESRKIPGVLVETEVTADGETEATGEKLVGKKASGTVTLFNRTDSLKTFESGTQLTGPGGTTYTLDEEVKIASASTTEKANFEKVSTPATEEVSITASTIGADFNQDDGIEFTIANFDTSSFVAKASGEIDGGTSREITAVSKDDIEVLRQQVLAEIEEKVVDQVSQSQEGFTGAVLLSDENEDPDEDFSAQVGEEAKNVTLKASLLVRSMTYKKSDIAKLAQVAVSDQIPASYQINEDDLDIEIAEVDESDPDSIEVVASVKINLVPEIDTETVRATVTGKFPAVTQEYFKSLPGFKRVVIDIKPTSLPDAVKTFPRVKDNIQVVVEMTDS